MLNHFLRSHNLGRLQQLSSTVMVGMPRNIPRCLNETNVFIGYNAENYFSTDTDPEKYSATKPKPKPLSLFGLSTAVKPKPKTTVPESGSKVVSETPTKNSPADIEKPKPLVSKGLARKATQSPGAPIPKSELSGEERLRKGLQQGFDFEKLGVGGADRQLGQIFRRIFSSRSAAPHLVKRLGVRHVKGLLLHGPPGTGKTLIARQLAKALNAPAPKVVNGPDIFQRFVGQSEENIRLLFEPAEKDFMKHGDQSTLHVIIFDEIDACMKARSGAGGSGTGTVVHDNVVNQLLVKLDGVQRLNNVLVIGITNRPDLLDPALLRPGRLEVQVEVGLPDAAGREQILQIMTRTMQAEGALSQDVNFKELGELSRNFSGAELEGLVNSATSWALQRAAHAAGQEGQEQELRVTMNDFLEALREVHPALGTRVEQLNELVPGGMLERCGSEFKAAQDTAWRMVKRLERGAARSTGPGGVGEDTREQPPGQVRSVLLGGRGGVGKSALAASLSAQSSVPLVSVLTPARLAGLPEQEVIQILNATFRDVWKSPTAILILDDLERILAFSDDNRDYHRQVLQTLLSLMKQRPPLGHRLLVLATTSLSEHHLQFLHLQDNAFQVKLEVPELNLEETRSVLRNHPEPRVKEEEVNEVVDMLHAEGNKGGVPMKHLLALMEMAQEAAYEDLHGYAKSSESKDENTKSDSLNPELAYVLPDFVQLKHVSECLKHMRAAGHFC